MEKETNKPINNALVQISYQYDSYGVYYILRMPKGAAATTDENGVAILPMADFSAGITLQADETRYRLDKKLIRKGGFPEGPKPYRSGDGIVDNRPNFLSN